MNRTIVRSGVRSVLRPGLKLSLAVFFLAACGVLSAQQQQPAPAPGQSPSQTGSQAGGQTGSQDPYQGQSNPPADDTITVPQPVQQPTEQAKPQAGKPLVPAQTAQPGQAARPTSADPSGNFPNPDAGNDNGSMKMARPAQGGSMAPELVARDASADPDGDIVHPHPMGPDTLPEGTMIRVHLQTLLSTANSRRGDEFRSTVASDVLQGGQVLIPAGAEIDGRVVDVSSGTAGGHGTIRLRPDTVILPDGSRYPLDAQVTGTPGSNAHVSSEGVIAAGSRYKKDGMEYGGGVGAGVITGAVVGGPVGALAGGLIGAGAITAHLLVAHPQAVLETGSVLIFSLNEQLDLQAARTARN